MSAVLYKPLGLLAELTHRCPLGCPYCSNPLALDPRGSELDTQAWSRVFTEAAALGVLQVHLSGGERALAGEGAVVTGDAVGGRTLAVLDRYLHVIEAGFGELPEGRRHAPLP